MRSTCEIGGRPPISALTFVISLVSNRGLHTDGFESKSIAWLTPRLANDGFMRIETTVTVSTCQAGAFRDRARSANKPTVERLVTVDPLRPVHKER